MVWGSNPDKGEIFHTHPDCSWGPPSLLYNGYWGPFLRVKQPGYGSDYPLPSSAMARARMQLYLYSPYMPA